MHLIDSPSPFSPIEQWRAHLARIKTLPQDDPLVRDAVQAAEREIAEKEAALARDHRQPSEERLRYTNDELIDMAARVFDRSNNQPDLTDAQRKELRRRANNVIAVVRRRHQKETERMNNLVQGPHPASIIRRLSNNFFGALALWIGGMLLIAALLAGGRALFPSAYVTGGVDDPPGPNCWQEFRGVDCD